MDKKTEADGLNFDKLAPRFQKKVYGGIKGKIRLAVIRKDLEDFFPAVFIRKDETPLKILDAGSGYGPFSLDLARSGHQVTLCDLSSNMLAIAEEKIRQEQPAGRVKLIHAAVQELPVDENHRYDLVLCHAVIDWVKAPKSLISCLISHMHAGSILSLTFYNRHGMIFKNLLRTNYKKIVKKAYTGWPGSLTPTHPRTPEEVSTWLSEHHLTILCHSGIRVFHDYVLDLKDREKNLETVLDLELEFSRRMPYRDLGRYQHILCRHQAASGNSRTPPPHDAR